MTANPDHYAIVIGLSRYPKLEPPPSDLQGPINDAKAVCEWLCDPAGGGLADENITLITSPDPVPDTGAPERDEIQRAFFDLAQRAEANRNSLGALLGLRLYVYVSGHGFSPQLNQGCLLAGNAGGLAQGANVWITRWLEQFQDAGYFFETVLWMDCCMNRDPRDEPSLTTLKPRVSPSPHGPSFAAFAARRPLRAVEQIGADGNHHGVFTTVLLEGLQGAAANSYGMVTGRSLADWLRNAQRSRLSTEDLADPRVSKEPDVLKEDQALIFARGVTPASFEVELSIPKGRDKEWRLWGGKPPTATTAKIGASNKVKLRLHPGLYVTEVEKLSLRQGFEVTGPVQLKIDHSGPHVRMGSDLVPISVNPDDPTAEIYLVDQSFHLVDKAIGRLDTKVPPGIYKTRIRSGDRLAEQIYLLDETPKAAEAVPELPTFDAAAPIPGTAFTHEYQIAALEDALRAGSAQAGTGAQILLMARVWREDDSTSVALPPAASLELWDHEKKLADLHEGQVSLGGDPYATVLIDVDPGTYFVRRGAAAELGVVEQSILAVDGWRTSYFLLVRPDPNQPVEAAQPQAGMLMHPIGAAFDYGADRLVLQAQSALGKSRAALSEELDGLLIEQPQSPLAAMLGAHLLILEQKKRPSLRIEKLKPLVDQLRNLTGSVPSGDADALALAAGSPDDPAVLEIKAPPMFRASWDMLVESSLAWPGLIPAEVYSRVFANAAVSPFLAWATDSNAREARKNSLKETFAPDTVVNAEESLSDFSGFAKHLQVNMPPSPIVNLPGAGFGGGANVSIGGPGIGGSKDAAEAADVSGEKQSRGWIGIPGVSISPEPVSPSQRVISEATASKLKALGLPANVLDL